MADKSKPKISKSYLHEVNQHKKTKKLLKDEKLEHDLTRDQLSVMEQDRDMWRDKFRKFEKEGGLFYLLDNEQYVIEAVTVPPYALSTYPQEIDNSLITKGVCKVVQGKMTVDNEKLKKYIGVILL